MDNLQLKFRLYKIGIVFDSTYWGMDNLNAILAEVNRRRSLTVQAAVAAKQALLAACNAFVSDQPTLQAASATGASQQTQLTALSTNMTSLNSTIAGLQTNLTSADATLAAAQQQVLIAQANRDAIANQITSASNQVAQTNSQIATLQASEITPAQIATLQAQVNTDTTALTSAATNAKNVFYSAGTAVDKVVTDCQAVNQSSISADVAAIS